jgi:hypothetical protein
MLGPVRASASRLLRLRIAAVACAAALVMVAPMASAASPADAATGAILVSEDGANFSTNLASGLFSRTGQLMPGDTVTRTLYVKNASSVAGVLRISRYSPALSSPFARAVSLSSTLGIPITSSEADGATVGCIRVVSDLPLAVGQSIAVPIILKVGSFNGATAKNETADIDLFVSMSDPAGPVLASPQCGDGGITIPASDNSSTASSGAHGSLAFTGTTMLYSSIMIGSVFLGLGLFVFIAGRRRRRGEA